MALEGRVALVTGGAGYLGSAVTKRLLADGARVVACERSQERLDALAEELGAPEALSTIACDVLVEDEVRQTVARVHDEHGGPDALLNIVGGFAGGTTVAETELAMWERMMALNLTSVFLCAKHALPLMLDAGFGRIVNISSKAAEDLPAKRAAYAVSKAGVLSLTACMAKEVAATGVVTPERIADVIAWLIGEDAGAINGSVLRLYGELI